MGTVSIARPVFFFYLFIRRACFHKNLHNEVGTVSIARPATKNRTKIRPATKIHTNIRWVMGSVFVCPPCRIA
jgi:hypothetical protein